VAHLVGDAERELGLAWEGDSVGAIACVPRVEVGLGAKMTGDGFGWECAVVVGQVMASLQHGVEGMGHVCVGTGYRGGSTPTGMHLTGTRS
jgi:hypothetical protein